MPTTTRNQWEQQINPQGSASQSPASTRRASGRSTARKPIVDHSDEEEDEDNEDDDDDEFRLPSTTAPKSGRTRRGSARSATRQTYVEDSDDELDDGDFSPTNFPSSPPVRKPSTPLASQTRPRPEPRKFSITSPLQSQPGTQHHEPSITPPTISPLSQRFNSPTHDSNEEEAAATSEAEHNSETEAQAKLREEERKAKLKSARLAEATRKRWADGRMKGPMEKRAATNEAKKAAKLAAQAAKNGTAAPSSAPSLPAAVQAPARRGKRTPSARTTAYKHAEDDDDEEDEEEDIVAAAARRGRRAPPPAPIKVSKYSPDESEDEEEKEEEEEEEEEEEGEDDEEDEDPDDEPNHFPPQLKGANPEHLITGQMPYFTPFFKRPGFAPQPPITGKEAWAANRVWDDEKKQYVVVDEKKLAKYGG